MNSKIYTAVLIALLMVLTFQSASACTGITLTGEDGSVVRGRTVEWGPFDLMPRLDIVPKGYHHSAEKMPDGKSGKTWKGKYGYVGISLLGKNAYTDGINETGLSAGRYSMPADKPVSLMPIPMALTKLVYPLACYTCLAFPITPITIQVMPKAVFLLQISSVIF